MPSKLSQPHIASPDDVGEHEGSLCMALEFVKGAPFKGASRHKSSRAISIFSTYQRMHHLDAGRPGEWNEVCQTLFAPPAGRVKQLWNSPRRIVVARAGQVQLRLQWLSQRHPSPVLATSATSPFGALLHVAGLGGPAAVQPGAVAPFRVELDAVGRIRHHQVRPAVLQQPRHRLAAGLCLGGRRW
jgi:hypothetical protein